MIWYNPGGMRSNLFQNMLEQPHLLIAGSTGSGKSVVINGIIYTALYNPPNLCKLHLIDPKRVELTKYRRLPHCVNYASEPADIQAVLNYAVDLMDTRYIELQKQDINEWQGGHDYIIIDEFADLMTRQKRETLPQLQTLAQLGRAAHIHIIAATQRPTKDIINGSIKVNMDSRLALRCPTKQDSRNILDRNGAETLPRYGFGYYLTPETMTPQLVKIPYTTPEDLAARVKWWTDQTPQQTPKQTQTRRHWWSK